MVLENLKKLRHLITLIYYIIAITLYSGGL